MTDRFWPWFGKCFAVACVVFTLTCACGFVYLLVRDYQDTLNRPYFTIAPDSTHSHPKAKP